MKEKIIMPIIACVFVGFFMSNFMFNQWMITNCYFFISVIHSLFSFRTFCDYKLRKSAKSRTQTRRSGRTYANFPYQTDRDTYFHLVTAVYHTLRRGASVIFFQPPAWGCAPRIRCSPPPPAGCFRRGCRRGASRRWRG